MPAKWVWVVMVWCWQESPLTWTGVKEKARGGRRLCTPSHTPAVVTATLSEGPDQWSF